MSNSNNSLALISSVFHCSQESCIYDIPIGQDTDDHITNFIDNVLKLTKLTHLRSFLTYYVEELVCNVQQHANASIAYGFVHLDEKSNHLFLGIADEGTTIFGSYVKAQKYLDLLAGNEANSLFLAQKGYSTKNLPDAENRGYGISSNQRIVTEGLEGAFVIISGNALSYSDKSASTIFELPDEIEWPGTIVLAEIPPTRTTIDLYKYIS